MYKLSSWSIQKEHIVRFTGSYFYFLVTDDNLLRKYIFKMYNYLYYLSSGQKSVATINE